MKVKYGDNIYNFEGDLDCLYFSNLIEEGINEVELNLFENVFKSILNKSLKFEEEKDYTTLYQALSYFGSNKKEELIKYLASKIYNKVRKELQKDIEDFFEFRIYFEETHNDKDMIDWYRLSKNTSISEEFFERHLDKIDWTGILVNRSISKDFIKKYCPVDCTDCVDNIDWDNANLEFTLGNVNLDNPIHASIIFRYYDLSNEFLNKNFDKIHWTHLCENPNISLEFFKEHIEYVDWYSLCSNRSIPVEFFKEHLDSIDWDCLSGNPNIPLKFLEENLDKINASDYISSNCSIPVRFFNEHDEFISWDDISRNTFNLQNEIRNFVTKTKYYDFEPLNQEIKREILKIE